MDPLRFVEDTSIGPSEEETLIPQELLTGNTKTGYVILTPESPSAPAMKVRIAHAGGLGLSAEFAVTRATTTYSGHLKSIYSKDIGIALVNPGETPIEIQIAYRGEGSDRSASTNLPPGYQTAKLLADLLPPGAEPLAGTLEISSRTGFFAVAIQFIGDRFQEVVMDPAVTSNKGKHTPILFPQFVMYGGWATTLILSNATDATATGRIKIFSATGLPMPVSLNGVTASEFKYSVSPHKAYTLSPVAASASSSQ
jgi:hypothetical protein